METRKDDFTADSLTAVEFNHYKEEKCLFCIFKRSCGRVLYIYKKKNPVKVVLSVGLKVEYLFRKNETYIIRVCGIVEPLKSA